MESNSDNYYDIERELELLSALLKNNNNADFIDSVSKDYFYHELNGKIFAAIISIIESGAIADVSSVADYMKSSKDFENAGGKNYLIEIIKISTITPVSNIAGFIKKFYLKRSFSDILKNSIQEIKDSPVIDIEKDIAGLESSLYPLSLFGSTKSLQGVGANFTNIIGRLDQIRKADAETAGIPSKLKDFDNLIGGLKDSDLVILAARPSMGKTALSVSMAYNIANYFAGKEDEKSVAFFSLEMSSDQLAMRIAAMHLSNDGINIGSRVFQDGFTFSKENGKKKLDDNDFYSVKESISDIQKLPLLIDDTPALSISQLSSRLRIAKKKHNIAVAFIDYLQLLKGGKRNEGNRVQEISEITQGLKAIAKELNIPIIALSQLSRAVEQRDDKKPQLSDLRESGSIEQDADIVLFLYREFYYLKREEPPMPSAASDDSDLDPAWLKSKKKYDTWLEKCEDCENLAELIIGKNRNGPIGKIKLAFDANSTKFADRIDINYEQISIPKSLSQSNSIEEQTQLDNVMDEDPF